MDVRVTFVRLDQLLIPGNMREHTKLSDADIKEIVREKLHEATPMSVDDALYQMELVGHPFYLVIDQETGQPAAVYHRHGWTYGVIRLDTKVN